MRAAALGLRFAPCPGRLDRPYATGASCRPAPAPRPAPPCGPRRRERHLSGPPPPRHEPAGSVRPRASAAGGRRRPRQVCGRTADAAAGAAGGCEVTPPCPAAPVRRPPTQIMCEPCGSQPHSKGCAAPPRHRGGAGPPPQGGERRRAGPAPAPARRLWCYPGMRGPAWAARLVAAHGARQPPDAATGELPLRLSARCAAGRPRGVFARSDQWIGRVRIALVGSQMQRRGQCVVAEATCCQCRRAIAVQSDCLVEHSYLKQQVPAFLCVSLPNQEVSESI